MTCSSTGMMYAHNWPMWEALQSVPEQPNISSTDQMLMQQLQQGTTRRHLLSRFLTTSLQSLRERFSDENRAVVSICSIIPAIVVSGQDLQGLAGKLKLYESDLPLAASLVNELRRWRLFWIQKKQAETTIPDTMKSALGCANKDCFPNIRILLILGCTLPITSAEAERSFSLLRRLKTHLRSRMTEVRLSSLALMSMHYDIYANLKLQDVAKKFLKDHSRHLYQPSLFTA